MDRVKDGNSQDIRIPKGTLEKCGINKKVDLQVKDRVITIRPVRVRHGWEESFKKMNQLGDDSLLISSEMNLDNEDWEW